jgi:hypothetical protein
MKKNMGSIDRAIRGFIAAGIGVLFFTGQISGVTGAVALLIGFVLAATSLVGFCPAYLPLGWSTCKANRGS